MRLRERQWNLAAPLYILLHCLAVKTSRAAPRRDHRRARKKLSRRPWRGCDTPSPYPQPEGETRLHKNHTLWMFHFLTYIATTIRVSLCFIYFNHTQTKLINSIRSRRLITKNRTTILVIISTIYGLSQSLIKIFVLWIYILSKRYRINIGHIKSYLKKFVTKIRRERSSKLAVTILWDKNRLEINIIVAVLNIPRSYLYENDFIV